MTEDEIDFDEIIEDLGIDLSKSLLNIRKDDLNSIIQGMLSNYQSKDLVDLIFEEFETMDFLKWLEKNRMDILNKVLNEPESEASLKEPVRRFMVTKWNLDVDFEVPLPVGSRDRSIDVCGFERKKKNTFLVAVELKIENTRGAIDKAFSQASDNAKGVDESYIAFSPLLFLKNVETIDQKLDDFDYIGVMVVDALNVLAVYEEPKTDYCDDEIYDTVLEYMETRFG